MNRKEKADYDKSRNIKEEDNEIRLAGGLTGSVSLSKTKTTVIKRVKAVEFISTQLSVYRFNSFIFFINKNKDWCMEICMSS